MNIENGIVLKLYEMNVLFLTLAGIHSIEDRGIYQDLLRTFRNKGHNVTIVTPMERRKKTKTNFQQKDGINLLQVQTLNITKTNVFEKGMGTLLIEKLYLAAVKKYLSYIKFDLILYSTPPITFSRVIEYVKVRDNAYTYLLLKDIFPQNAVDMKLLKKSGFLYKYFRKKERKLYAISDTIGCMSPANVDFILKHNPEIVSSKVEVNPNSIEPLNLEYIPTQKQSIRLRYELPLDKKIFMYGGNLGKPQGIDFLIETIESCGNEHTFFLIVGEGTAYMKIKKWFLQKNPKNAKLLKRLPKPDYDLLLAACDVGLIFLHPGFSIPNFPSRLLSYLEMKKPVVAATDSNTDIGDIIQNAGCGYKVLSGDIAGMKLLLDKLVYTDNLSKMGEKSWDLLVNKFGVKYSYYKILEKIINKDKSLV